MVCVQSIFSISSSATYWEFSQFVKLGVLCSINILNFVYSKIANFLNFLKLGVVFNQYSQFRLQQNREFSQLLNWELCSIDILNFVFSESEKYSPFYTIASVVFHRHSQLYLQRDREFSQFCRIGICVFNKYSQYCPQRNWESSQFWEMASVVLHRYSQICFKKIRSFFNFMTLNSCVSNSIREIRDQPEKSLSIFSTKFSIS